MGAYFWEGLFCGGNQNLIVSVVAQFYPWFHFFLIFLSLFLLFLINEYKTTTTHPPLFTVTGETVESFRSAYEYDFRISNQLSSQSHRFSLFLINRGYGFRNNFGVLFGDLEYAIWV